MRECFIANSVTTKVTVEALSTTATGDGSPPRASVLLHSPFTSRIFLVDLAILLAVAYPRYS
jgi:hypothetical protein